MTRIGTVADSDVPRGADRSARGVRPTRSDVHDRAREQGLMAADLSGVEAAAVDGEWSAAKLRTTGGCRKVRAELSDRDALGDLDVVEGRDREEHGASLLSSRCLTRRGRPAPVMHRCPQAAPMARWAAGVPARIRPVTSGGLGRERPGPPDVRVSVRRDVVDHAVTGVEPDLDGLDVVDVGEAGPAQPREVERDCARAATDPGDGRDRAPLPGGTLLEHQRGAGAVSYTH